MKPENTIEFFDDHINIYGCLDYRMINLILNMSKEYGFSRIKALETDPKGIVMIN